MYQGAVTASLNFENQFESLIEQLAEGNMQSYKKHFKEEYTEMLKYWSLMVEKWMSKWKIFE